MIDGAAKDRQSITSDGAPLIELIDGVTVREVKNVPKGNGVLTEIFRADWQLDAGAIDQMFETTVVSGGAYCYEDPDHWRLPPDTSRIPYSFAPRSLADGLR
jgi:hypothetical protein